MSVKAQLYSLVAVALLSLSTLIGVTVFCFVKTRKTNTVPIINAGVKKGHMKSLSVLLFMLMSISGSSFAANWLHAGGDQINESLFADTESIKHDKGRVRVWIQAVKMSDLAPTPDNRALVNMDEVRKKVKKGDTPLFLTTTNFWQGLNQEGRNNIFTGIYVQEILVNAGATIPTMKGYVEIDCSQQQSRTLRAIIYNDDGAVKSQSSEPDNWKPVAPDTAADGWRMMFCVKRR